MKKPVKELRYDESMPRWVETKEGEVEKHEDGTVDVFAWGYKFTGCKLNYTLSDRFEPATEYVIVEHPTGNFLRVWWIQ